MLAGLERKCLVGLEMTEDARALDSVIEFATKASGRAIARNVWARERGEARAPDEGDAIARAIAAAREARSGDAQALAHVVHSGFHALLFDSLNRLPRDPGGPALPALLDLLGGRVTLEGLEFLIESGEATSAIRLEDAEVVVRRCAFRRPGPAPPGSRASAIQVRSSSRGPLGSLGDRAGASLTVEASEFDGGQAGVVASGRAEVGIRDSTFGPAPTELAMVGVENPEGGAVPAEVRLSHVSALTGAGPVFRFVGTAPRVRVAESAFAPPTTTSPPSVLVAIDAPERLDWRGVDNLYGRVGVYLRPGGMRAPTRSFEAWADDPTSTREAGSVATEAPPWEERDPINAVALGLIDPSRAFRLSLGRAAPPRVGARQGPAGPLPGPSFVATPPPSISAPTPAAAPTTIVAADPAPIVPPLVEPARPRELAQAPAPANRPGPGCRTRPRR